MTIPHIDKPLSYRINHRLFQASMWRRYALDWMRVPGGYGYPPGWLDQVLRVDLAGCLRRSRLNVRLARRLRLRAGR